MTKPGGLTSDDYVRGVLAGDRIMLARAITLVESRAAKDEVAAGEVLRGILPAAGRARRVGISGAPGVGKSTFIEALGLYLLQHEHKVAVLTIDPSSSISGGSILGDKTRMECLSREPNAFIRPSPAAGTLGGVARATREALLLCEAAGFDVILVESVGVGQSETTLRSMVDYLLLLLLPGAGDELQGIKKGIMEIADGILVNKADGANRLAAEQSRVQQQASVNCLLPATRGWKTEVGLCSAQTGDGVPAAWERVETFYRELEPRGIIAARRKEQMLDWLMDVVRDSLQRDFDRDARVQKELPAMRRAVLDGSMTPAQAAAALLETHRPGCGKQDL